MAGEKWTAKITNVSDHEDTVDVYIEFRSGDLKFEKIYHFIAAESLDIENIKKLAREEVARIGDMKANVAILKEHIGIDIDLENGGDK